MFKSQINSIVDAETYHTQLDTERAETEEDIQDRMLRFFEEVAEKKTEIAKAKRRAKSAVMSAAARLREAEKRKQKADMRAKFPKRWL